MAESNRRYPGSVLVGSDLSEASDRVIQEAARIAERGGAKLHVVSAYPAPVSGFGPGSEQAPSDAVLDEVRHALPAQLRRILPEDRQPETQEVRFGSAARVILDRAREAEAGLLILGPHRGRDVHAQFLGTTADEVLRFADVPCLALRGTLPIPLNRIGVATDFSPIGDEADEKALDWAQWLGDTKGDAGTIVCALHILTPEQHSSPEECRSELQAGLDQHAAARQLPSNVRLSSEVVVDADVPDALVRWAEQSSVDLVVIGTHGRSGWQRSNLGSVSSAVARRAPCPVLLVPTSRKAESSKG